MLCAGCLVCAMNVLLIRVPKTASGTVAAAVQQWHHFDLCNISKLKVIHRPDEQNTRPTASDLRAADKVILTTRDPLARFVSAFNWRHPRNKEGTHLTAGTRDAHPFEDKLYGCFDHVSELADALVRSSHNKLNHQSISMCESLAWEACAIPNSTSPTISMLQAGIFSYVAPAGLPAFLARPLQLLHTEDLAAGLDRLYRWLECDPLRVPPKLPQVHTKSYPGKSDTQLSQMGEYMLRFALGHEYAMHHSLLFRGSLKGQTP